MRRLRCERCSNKGLGGGAYTRPEHLTIVWGTDDQLFDPAWAAWLDRTLPRSTGVRLVAGAKLFFPEEMPDVIAAEARRLWGA